MSGENKKRGFWRALFDALADERSYWSVDEWRDRRVAALEAEVKALRARAATADPCGDPRA